ncbi:GTP-binding protein [Polaribacter sp. PL03]|uniref:GTP-binding protein n=1 Tax=Polaribacter sp. PL03 TaxID=3088353 RepID=UPI0029D38E44|nr:GTP-binding protein [Polaribacter sp. PL03]MDX6748051.1 GTP-binding protein [Polaribacter sp. PL03]
MAVKEKRNSDVFLRPRFSIDLKESSSVVLNRFSKVLNKEKTSFRGNVVDAHVFISVSKKVEHFWSPQLHLEIIETSEQKSELKGLFGPKPQVWTLFMFIHFVIGISFLGFCVLLYTRISLKESLFFPLIMMIFLPLIWCLLYFLGKIGKDVGKSQMQDLHDFMIENI